MPKLYADLIQPDDSPTLVTKFQILTQDRLPFDYYVDKAGMCTTDSDNYGIEHADALGYIHIVERDVSESRNRFSGGPEPIRNSTELKFVAPCEGVGGVVGGDLRINPFGDWKCTRCDNISHVPVTGGKIVKPFECFNDSCGRRGPFTPIFPEHLIKPIWRLPLAPIECSSLEVYNDVYNFCKEYLVVKEDEYHIMTLWIMASWLVDDFQTCPYLCAIAPKSSGKTQMLNVLNELAYRAVMTISVTAASLFRAIELWHITLLIDEAEFQVKQETESGQALYGCLNGGYKRGSYAIRTEGDNSNRIPATYEVFGFKAIATTRLFHPTLESRSIIINMAQGMPDKILIDEGRAGIIRAKLLFWRFDTLGKLPLVFPKSNNGRLIEMFIPLLTVAQIFKGKEGVKKQISYEDLEGILIDKIDDMESGRKEEEHESDEAKIVGAINNLSIIIPGDRRQDQDKDTINIKDIVEYLGWVDGSTSSTDAMKTYQKVGRTLKIMGIKTHHTKKGKVIEYLEPDVREVLLKLSKRFG